jgi:hypothetical protein
MIDAYTTSEYHLYSEPFASGPIMGNIGKTRNRPLFSKVGRELRGTNYIRNSVKIVINAFDGSVTFYVFEPEDPLIQAWAKIFPGLFKDKKEMPEAILSHIRYPSDMLLLQGLVYAKYHMTDPAVFYN